MGRAPCCDKANVKRGPWSPEEDATLKNYLEKHGTGGNWIALPRKAGLKRCGKSCRLRWLNYLRPDIKHGGFTEEEDKIICTLYNTMGSRWSLIASKLPGRTDNDVKNYWNTKLKKKMLAVNNINNKNIIDTRRRSRKKINKTNHHSTTEYPMPQSLISTDIPEASDSYNPAISSCLPPLLEMSFHQNYCDPQGLINLDQHSTTQFIPFSNCMEVPNFGSYGSNSYTTTSLEPLNNNCACVGAGAASFSGNGSSLVQDDDGIVLSDIGLVGSPYDELLNDLCFQEKYITTQVDPYLGNI